MKPVIALAVVAGLVMAAGHHQGVAYAAPAAKAKKVAKTPMPTPAPVEVEVVSVDAKKKTITVRDVVAVPAPAGKTVSVILPVPIASMIRDVKPGEKVALTCGVKPAVHVATGTPVILTDCVKVIKIDRKS